MDNLDVAFDKWCDELVVNGLDPIEALRIRSQYRFVWEECRKRCAVICFNCGDVDLATAIMKNFDGSVGDFGQQLRK